MTSQKKKNRTKRFQNLVGTTFGRLTVVQELELGKSGHTFWGCVCACGNAMRANGANLRRGNINSCGCLQREICIQRFKKARGERGKNLLFKRYQRDARTRGIEWSLSLRDFENLTQQPCHYCASSPRTFIGNIKPGDSSYHGTYFYNGLDRTNATLGYELANVVPCCKTCNFAKLKKSDEEFYSWVSRVRKHPKQFPSLFSVSEVDISRRDGKQFSPGVVGKRLLLQVYTKRAKALGRVFTLSTAEFVHLTSLPCHYCGHPPANEIGSRKNAAEFDRTKYRYSSLDRKNQDEGYTFENALPACHECNIAKHVQSYAEFLVWIDQVRIPEKWRRDVG